MKELKVYRRANLPEPGRYSPSQVSMYQRCPRQYYYTYKEGLIIPPRAAMLLGRACHWGFSENYKQKIESEKDLPADEIMDIYGESFDANISAWEKELIDWEENMYIDGGWHRVPRKPDEIKDEGYGITKLYTDKVAPVTQPVAVEQKQKMRLVKVGGKLKFLKSEGEGISLMGYVDLIKKGNHIVDHKIRKRMPTTQDITNSLQLTSYAVAWALKQGLKLEDVDVALDYFLRYKKSAGYKSYISARTMQQVQELKDATMDLDFSVKHNFFPRRMEGWQCSPQWCGFHGLCRGEQPKVTFIRDVSQKREKEEESNGE